MNNFEYSNPTRLVFGKGEESRIGELMRARVPAMSPVLVVYGGGSAKESGLLERISESLKAADLVPIELGGVTPNPQLFFCSEGYSFGPRAQSQSYFGRRRRKCY